MHPSSILRMEWFVNDYATKAPAGNLKVLDVGSYDVNGSYRPLFNDSRFKYTGLDMAAGPNVDIALENPYDWSALETDSYDCVISGQAFEHIEFFWVTMAEMTRVLKPGGLLCLIAPNGFAEHRYPVDCYRFFTDGMIALARYCQLDVLHAHTNCGPTGDDNWVSDTAADSMLVARKTYSGPARHPNFARYQCVPAKQETLRNGFVPYQRKRGVKLLWHKLSRRLFK